MSQETRDTIDGMLIFIPFFLLISAAAWLLFRLKRRRYNQALVPLAPLIGGTLHSDGNSAIMRGAWQGRPLGVQVSPDTRHDDFRGHPNEKRNILRLELDELPGRHDWKVVFENRWGVGEERWRIKADTPALAAYLAQAGIIEALDALGNWPVVWYSARQRRLSYLEDIRPRLAPPPARFRQQLAVLAQLAGINERVNQG
jgi:hypothetical protein